MLTKIQECQKISGHKSDISSISVYSMHYVLHPTVLSHIRDRPKERSCVSQLHNLPYVLGT